MTRVLPRPSAQPEVPPARAPKASPQRTVDCDICIVGDDLAAHLLAFDLAHRGNDVILLPDQRAPRLGIGGVLAPGYRLPVTELVERVGEADAQELLVLSAAAAARGMDMAAAAGVALGPKGRLTVARSHAAEALVREHAARAALVPDSSVLLDATDAAGLLQTDLFAAALGIVPAERVDAVALRAALAEAARAEGVRVLDQPAVSVDVDGLRKYVFTAGLQVRAYRIAFCGGAGLAPVAPAVGAALETGFWVCGTLVGATRRIHYAGVAEETGATGLAFHFDGDGASFAAETATLVRGRRTVAAVLRRHAAEAYPDLATAEAGEARAVRLAWPRRGMPVIQEIAPGVFHAVTAGDGELAHGVLAAGLIAGAMLDRDDRIALFQPFGLEPAVRTIGGLSRVAAYWHARLTAQLAPKHAPEGEGEPAPATAATDAVGSGLEPALAALPAAVPARSAAVRPARAKRGVQAAADFSRGAVRAALGVAMRRGGDRS